MIEITNWSETALSTPLEICLSHELNQLIEPIIFIGGVHGDEPEGVQLALHLKEHLNSINELPHLALIPCLNPDGYASKSRTNSNGVDLNRNFPSPDWVKTYEDERYNPGRTPGSELETKALTQLIKTTNPRLIIHFHSWKPSIVLTGPPTISEAQVFSKTSGYPLELDIGYPTPGSLGQYAWLSHSTPVICLEEKERECPLTSWHRFMPAFESILNIKK